MSIGIYCIFNTVNHKRYIGQSWNIEHRITMHKLNKKETHLTLSFKKYGLEKFQFQIIETLDPNIATQEMLDEREIFYIAEFDCLDDKKGYNKRHGGSRGKHTDDARKKVSNTKKSQHLTGERCHHYGIPKTEESKQKMSMAKKKAYVGQGNPFFGKKHSDETREKIRIARENHKGKNHPWYGKHHSDTTKEKFRELFGKQVRCIETGVIYKSQQEAGKAYGGSGSPISACINGKVKTVYGMHWERIVKDPVDTDHDRV